MQEVAEPPLTVQLTVKACPPRACEPLEVVWEALWEMETVGGGATQALPFQVLPEGQATLTVMLELEHPPSPQPPSEMAYVPGVVGAMKVPLQEARS